MNDRARSKEELIKELSDLRRENNSLKTLVSETEKRTVVLQEFRKAEEALRYSEERYQIISSMTSDYIFRLKVEEDGLIKTDLVSDNYPSITNRTIDDIITPDHWLKIIHEDDRPMLMNSLHFLISEGGSSDLECRSYLPDGNSRTVRVVAHAIKNKENEKTAAIVGAVKDISVKKKAETALAYEQKLLKTLVDLMPSFVYVKDCESRFLMVNKACAQYMGASSPNEMIGKTDFDFYDQESSAAFLSDEQDVLKGISLLNKIEYGNTPNNTQSILLTNKIPFFDSEGNIIGLVGISYDITELKHTEEALIKAKEKAEESDRLKSAFLANMGHEIRTPMNGIMGFSELLKDPGLSGEEQQIYVNIIEKSGARMLNIINDLIDISKIESGLMSINFSKCNLNEQLEDIYSFFKPEAEGKGLKLTYEANLPEEDAIIKTDREKINAILINLIKNAIKFTTSGSIDFGYIINPSSEGRKSEELEFFVKDTGVGVDLEYREIIFQRFRQGSESLNRNYEGAGLGLSISKSYVEMLGGKIWVESNSGGPTDSCGSKFYFTTPYNPEKKEKKSKKAFLSDKGEDRTSKIYNILIAEDNLASEILFSTMIGSLSKNIFNARNGNEAVEYCRSNSEIDLVLMDLKMPVMDGYEAVRQIRQFDKNVIIIAQTAFAQSGDMEKALKVGCNDYITKPIKKEELLLLIGKHLSSR
jgi:PAS domain S-box-containing protein